MRSNTQKIIPCLWFDDRCKEAMEFYTSFFPEGKINNIRYYPENAKNEHLKNMQGKVLTGEFELAGFQFRTLDGGPIFKINPSISFILNFDPSKDKNAAQTIETFWKKLSEEGKVLMEFKEYPFSKKYGWCEDQFGVSWQLMLTNPEGDDRPFITPELMFTGKNTNHAEEALQFYGALFKESQKGNFHRHPEAYQDIKKGSMMYADFKLSNVWIAVMDGGSMHSFTFNEALSFYIACKDQDEIDYFWKNLSAVPEAEQCGWVKDKYGVSWQIVPENIDELLNTPEALEAMMKMKKLDIEKLKKA